mmetsp:Transcript_70898/g.118718  ORF Transcript_70898/g.118718 Transcript_70898/m.118718 type:complete len:231 (-) Transcript_70898:40-732(-)
MRDNLRLILWQYPSGCHSLWVLVRLLKERKAGSRCSLGDMAKEARKGPLNLKLRGFEPCLSLCVRQNCYKQQSDCHTIHNGTQCMVGFKFVELCGGSWDSYAHQLLRILQFDIASGNTGEILMCGRRQGRDLLLVEQRTVCRKHFWSKMAKDVEAQEAPAGLDKSFWTTLKDEARDWRRGTSFYTSGPFSCSPGRPKYNPPVEGFLGPTESPQNPTQPNTPTVTTPSIEG